MKRYILFMVFVLLGTAASAQQNINNSLKDEKLFKQLVVLKGLMLKEMQALKSTQGEDSIIYHLKCIRGYGIGGAVAMAIPKSRVYTLDSILVNPLNQPFPLDDMDYFKQRNSSGFSGILWKVSEEADTGIKINTTDGALDKAVKEILLLEPGLREAMIIY